MTAPPLSSNDEPPSTRRAALPTRRPSPVRRTGTDGGSSKGEGFLPPSKNKTAPPPPYDANPDLGEVVVAADELVARVAELGKAVTADYADRPPLLVGVLKGAFVFMSDLARAIDLPVAFEFMAVASYGSSTKSSGVVRIVKDLDVDLSGRHVLLVEDIVDSGLTLSYLRRALLARHPASLEVCALLVRDGGIDLGLRYVGFHVPATFVVGYGLDADERYRNLPFVCAYTPAAAG